MKVVVPASRLVIALFMSGMSGHAAEASLVPRDVLFGPVAYSMPRLSPDGTRLAYMAPSVKGGGLNVWLTSSATGSKHRKPLTHMMRGSVSGYRWAEDNKHILYWRDNEGDEKWHLYAVDIQTGRSRDLTPFPNVRIQNIITSSRLPHEVLVGLNRRDPAMFDMFRIDLERGSIQLDTLNPGDVLSWTADQNLIVRAATAFVPDTGTTVLRVRDRQADPWRDLMSWSFEDSIFPGQINGGSITAGYAMDGQSLYVTSTSGSDKSKLVKVDVASGYAQSVAASSCDVANDTGYSGVEYDVRSLVLQNPLTSEPDAVAFECEQRAWKALSPDVGADLAYLKARLPGFPYITSRNRSDTIWLVAAWAGDRLPEYSLYYRRTKTVKRLFSDQPKLTKGRLFKPISFTFTARDGMDIPVYLTRPAGDAPAPLVLYPHGGPWYRDHADYDPTVQFLVNRGYAVLQVEYRGSVGFGKAFLNAGNHEYGLKMRDDLIDAVEWTIQHGFADAARVGVYGESAGGYLALRVAEARPDLFQSVIDVVGPTDIKFLLESMPKSWHVVKARWVRRIGDAEHDEALNRALSPRFVGELLRTSFLIAQGANDPRVDPRHAESMAATLRHQGAPVDYVVYLNEGHGISRPENKLDFYGRVEDFFARTLHGRKQPASVETSVRVEVK